MDWTWFYFFPTALFPDGVGDIASTGTSKSSLEDFPQIQGTLYQNRWMLGVLGKAKNSASHKRQPDRFHHRSEVFRGSRPKLHTTMHPPTCLDLLCTPDMVVSYDEFYGHSQPKHHVAPVMRFKFMPIKDAVMPTLDPCWGPWKPSFLTPKPKADLIFCAHVHGATFLQLWIHMMHEMMIPNQPPKKFNFKKCTWNCFFKTNGFENKVIRTKPDEHSWKKWIHPCGGICFLFPLTQRLQVNRCRNKAFWLHNWHQKTEMHSYISSNSQIPIRIRNIQRFMASTAFFWTPLCEDCRQQVSLGPRSFQVTITNNGQGSLKNRDIKKWKSTKQTKRYSTNNRTPLLKNRLRPIEIQHHKICLDKSCRTVIVFDDLQRRGSYSYHMTNQTWAAYMGTQYGISMKPRCASKNDFIPMKAWFNMHKGMILSHFWDMLWFYHWTPGWTPRLFTEGGPLPEERNMKRPRNRSTNNFGTFKQGKFDINIH